jgi:hypothetical protein
VILVPVLVLVMDCPLVHARRCLVDPALLHGDQPSRGLRADLAMLGTASFHALASAGSAFNGQRLVDFRLEDPQQHFRTLTGTRRCGWRETR